LWNLLKTGAACASWKNGIFEYALGRRRSDFARSFLKRVNSPVIAAPGFWDGWGRVGQVRRSVAVRAAADANPVGRPVGARWAWKFSLRWRSTKMVGAEIRTARKSSHSD